MRPNHADLKTMKYSDAQRPFSQLWTIFCVGDMHARKWQNSNPLDAAQYTSNILEGSKVISFYILQMFNLVRWNQLLSFSRPTKSIYL